MARRWYLFVFFSVISLSCNGKLLSQHISIPPQASFSYCDSLHVRSKPYPSIGSKPYLGIYSAYKKLEQPVQACKDSTFIQVAGVIDGTPAEKAGFKDGDIILSINGN